MLSELRIIHPPSAAANPSEHPVVLITVGGSRYIFNVPEGTTRSIIHRHVSAGGSGDLDIFVPNSCSAARGLAGFLMTMSDSGKKRINAFGPPCLAHAIATMRFYCKRSGTQLKVRESHVFDEQNGDLLSAGNQPLLDRGDGVVVRALPSWDSAWTNTPVLKTEAGPADQDPDPIPASKKRRRSSNPAQEPEIAPPISNAEHDAAEFAAKASVADPSSSSSPSLSRNSNGLSVAAMRASRGRAFATAHSMVSDPTNNSEGSSSMQNGNGRPPRVTGAAYRSNQLAQPWLAPHSDSMTKTPPTQAMSLSYLMSMPDLPGKVDVNRARAVGISPGPNLSKLQMGESVTITRPIKWNELADDQKAAWLRQAEAAGKKNYKKKAKANQGQAKPELGLPTEEVVIESSACVGTPTPGSVVFMVNLPSPSHLPSFLSVENAQITAEALQGRFITTMIHSSPLSVVQDEQYKSWVSSISSPQTHHIYTTAGVGADNLLYPASILPMLRLSSLDPEMFAIPPYRIRPAIKLDDILPASVKDAGLAVPLSEDLSMRLQPRCSAPTNVQDGAAGAFNAIAAGKDVRSISSLEYQVSKSAQTESQSKSKVADTARQRLDVARAQAFDEFLSVSNRIKEQVSTMKSSAHERAEWNDIKITTLGTGSAQPSRYRGVAATLIELPERLRKPTKEDRGRGHFYMLLDAGEGTLGQLAQQCVSQEKLKDLLRRLRVLFVSHIHGDHCAGVNTLLRARAELSPDSTEPLYVIGGNFTRTFIQEWNDLEDVRCRPFTSQSQEKPAGGQVVFLECEHLDYKLGINAQAEHSSEQNGSSDDTAHLAHLREGFQIGYDRSSEAVRRKLVAQEPYASMSESDLKGHQAHIDERVKQIIAWKDPNSREGQNAQRSYETAKQFERNATRESWSHFQSDLGDHIGINTVEVDHRARHCYGIVVRINHQSDSNRFSFSYSGDTRPTSKLEEAAHGVDLFIHEATIQDEEAGMAFEKGHSTVGGAITSGQKAGAKVTLLTHFSQRYPQMARLQHQQQTSKREPILAIGMDMLTLKMNDMWKMSRYLPAMEVLFKADAVGAPEEDNVGNGTD
ncbi:unnamed protein product [Sympodiomycopsis kandeliae]